MSIKVAGGVSNTLADVSVRNQLKVQPETDVETYAAHVGAVKLFSENDAGSVTNEMYLKSPETSSDYRLRVGLDTILFEDAFNGLTQNTNLWSYTSATLTAAQPGAGTVNFSTVQGTTNAHGAQMRTFQYFPLINTAPLAIEFIGGSFTAPLVSGEVWLAGIGLPGSAILPPADGVFWKVTSGGVEGILKFNGSEFSTGVLTTQPEIDKMERWIIIIGERKVEFWADDVLLGEKVIPAGNAVPWLGISAPLFMMKYNTGNVSNTNQMRVARCAVSLMDIASTRDWGYALGTMGRCGNVGQNGHTMGSTAGNSGGTAALVGTQAGSNTAPNAAMAGLGGIFQMTAQASAAGASGDMVAQYYLNPVPSINITGRNLVIAGVRIMAINYGAVVATTPTTLVWGLAYGHTNVSLATPETGSFVTATTHAPRRVMLGMNYVPVGAVIGQPYDKEINVRFDGCPIVVRPGEYVATTVRFLVGTATASQTVVYTIAYNCYWE